MRRLSRPFLSLVAATLALGALPALASATWSVIAIDARTGRIVIASATCIAQATLRRFPAEGLMDIQAIVVPGMGVAAVQAGLERTRKNQALIYRELERGTAPEHILDLLRQDSTVDERQFGIVDRNGRVAGFSGSENGRASLDRGGRVPGTDVYYSIQGNLLTSSAVVEGAVVAFLAADGSLEDRAIAAMEAADAAGGDRRCSCQTRPVPAAPCETRHALVAYLLAADPRDPQGTSFNDGGYRLYIDVTDENILPSENANPVVTLRTRYDAMKER
jgi:uncharacterized Ntn-hydrolase superfamily protein